MSEVGIKHDHGKPRWSLLPMDAVEDVVRAITYGAAKYSDGNWQHVDPARYHDALFRHLKAWSCGERLDPESGLPHLAHAGASLLFVMWHDARR